MNLRAAALAVALVAATLALPAAARAQVRWQTGALDGALEAARHHHRVVLVDFSATWCGPCQVMEQTVWRRADVGHAVARGFVPLQVDADTPEGTRLRQQYSVGALPTLLAIRADGREHDRLTGEADASTVLQVLDAWRRGDSTLPVMAARLAQRPADVALRLQLGARYAERGDEANASLHLRRVVTDDPTNAGGHAAPALYALGDTLYLRTRRDPARAIPVLQDLVTRFPQTDAARRASVPLAQALHQAGRDADALRVLDAYVSGASGAALGVRANDAAWMMFRQPWDLPRAERFARLGYASAPRDHALIDTLARIVAAQGRHAEAAELEAQAARLDPRNAEYQRVLTQFRAAAAAAGAGADAGAAGGGQADAGAPRQRTSRRR